MLLENKNKTQDLVYQAYEAQTEKQARNLIAKAIKLDPDNADAYNLLGDISEDYKSALSYYKKGLKAGEKSIGRGQFRELTGHFWGFHETRPYMRAKAGIADCFKVLGNKGEAIEHYQEMLILNPNDNQGVRYPLLALLIEAKDFTAIRKLKRSYTEEITADWLYNMAIYQFIQNGDSKQAQRAAIKAIESNHHVLNYLFCKKDLPEYNPDYFSIGSEEEAIIYVDASGYLWLDTQDALQWLTKIINKIKS